MVFSMQVLTLPMKILIFLYENFDDFTLRRLASDVTFFGVGKSLLHNC